MPTDADKELFEKLKIYHDALAYANVYQDLNSLLAKYEEKINRLLNQAKRRCETLEKNNSSASTRSRALEEETVLLIQSSYTQKIRIEILQRANAALEKLKSAKLDYIEAFKQIEKIEDWQMGHVSVPLSPQIK